jgi:hypothetical protein
VLTKSRRSTGEVRPCAPDHIIDGCEASSAGCCCSSVCRISCIVLSQKQHTHAHTHTHTHTHTMQHVQHRLLSEALTQPLQHGTHQCTHHGTHRGPSTALHTGLQSAPFCFPASNWHWKAGENERATIARLSYILRKKRHQEKFGEGLEGAFEFDTLPAGSAKISMSPHMHMLIATRHASAE